MPFEFDVESEYLGTWEPYIFDKEKDVQVFLRIRPLTEDHNEAVQKKYGKFRMNKRQGVRQRQVPAKNQKAVGLANVLFMWTGIRNGFVRMSNEATAAFFGKCLGKQFEVGATIELPENLCHPKDLDPKAPRLLDELKTLMVRQDVRISNKVVSIGMGVDDEEIEDTKADEDEQDEQAKELEKN
jgi:hypothetical protein